VELLNFLSRIVAKRIVTLVAVVAVVPVWIPTYFPATDLPQHAAQIGMLANLHAPTFPTPDLFRSNWFTPYLLGYGILYLLRMIFGLLVAFRIVISGSLLLFVLASAQFIRAMDGDERLALLAIPTLYGGVTMWGFLNFLVAAPVGLYFLVQYLRFLCGPTWLRGFAIAVLFMFLFFSHILICAFFGVLAIAMGLFDVGALSFASKILPLLPPIPCGIVWLLRSLGHPGVARSSIEFHSIHERLAMAVSFTFGWEDKRAAVLGLLFLLLPLLGYRFRRHVRFWIPFGMTSAAVLFLPYGAMGTAFIFPRFSLFLFSTYAVALSPRQRTRARAALAAIAVVAICWSLWEGHRMDRFETESAGFSTVLSAMEPNQTCLAVPLVRNSDYAYGLPYMHFASWYAGLKDGVVWPTFARTHIQLIVLKPDIPVAANLPWRWEWAPLSFSSKTIVQHFRYIIVSSPEDKSGFIFKEVEPAPILRVHKGLWWLYENPAPSGI